ncbi:helix-turn-helix domain-containing protein [Flavobacterium artemisiae]|uniref:Helix-turn-helix domain-containing protein n=1 Tax=Flavobacterium artemisiae TaxID=2126556 RepID=A0ABW4HA26_9FLAO
MYNEKLGRFFKSKGLKQKEVGEILGYSPAMMGRYLHGTANIGPDFLISLHKHFPEIDLNDLFRIENAPNVVNDSRASYEKSNVLIDLEDIENRIHKIRLHLEKKNFED